MKKGAGRKNGYKTTAYRRASSQAKDPKRVAAAYKGWETRRLRAAQKAAREGDIEIEVGADLGDAAVAVQIIQERIKKACEVASKDLAALGASVAKAAAPRRTGALAASIGIASTDDGETWSVVARAPHAATVHSGSRKTYEIPSTGRPTIFHEGTYNYAPRWNGVRAPGQPGPGRSMYYVIHRGHKKNDYMRAAQDAIRKQGGVRAARIIKAMT